MSEGQPERRRRRQTAMAVRPPMKTEDPAEPIHIAPAQETQPKETVSSGDVFAPTPRRARPNKQPERSSSKAQTARESVKEQASAQAPRRTKPTVQPSASAGKAQTARENTKELASAQAPRRTKPTRQPSASAGKAQAARESAKEPAFAKEPVPAKKPAPVKEPAPAQEPAPRAPLQEEGPIIIKAAPLQTASPFVQVATPRTQKASPVQAAPRAELPLYAQAVPQAKPAPKEKAAPRAQGNPPEQASPKTKKPAKAPAKTPAKAPAKKSAPKPARKLTAKERRQRAKQVRNTVISLLGAALVITLVVVVSMSGRRLVDIKRALDEGDGVFYRNIYVNDIPLEGRTLDEAASVVTQQVVSLISSWKITLKTQDGQSWDITGSDLNMKYDVADQLDQLWAIGHTGSSSTRYEQVKALEETPVMRYTTLSYDMTNVNQILAKVKAEIDTPAVNATRYPDDSKWPPYSYTDDIPGMELDITGLNDQISGMVDSLESGTVYLTPVPVQASVTREYLESQIVELATYDTTIGATSEPGRFINIRVGTEKFDHLTIAPRESVSFNKVTGLRNYANGYADAPEIAYGEYVTGVGGGICQVSSTLYNAVVMAGLDVTQRTQHSHPSNYVPHGLDATVQDNRLDFVFYNNTGAELFISTEYYEKSRYYHCRFTIYGRPDPDGYTYRLESEDVEVLEAEPNYIRDTEAQYVVYEDEEHQASKGEKGYVVNVYKVTLDKDGKEVTRVLDHTDTYKPTPARIYVGVTPREGTTF